MKTDKPLLAGGAPWSTAAAASEVRVRPRPGFAALRAGHPFARLAAGLRPRGLRALDLDFHPPRYSGLGLGFLAAGLLLAAAALAEYGNASDQVRQWRGEQARQQQASGRQAALRPGDEAAMQEAAQAIAAVNADIGRPWEALFAAIEAARSEDVALLSISPDATRQVVRIAGEARDREAILAYIEDLGQASVLGNVVLIEDQLQQQDPQKPFRFMLAADWRMGEAQ